MAALSDGLVKHEVWMLPVARFLVRKFMTMASSTL